jgi:hypothetical protein
MANVFTMYQAIEKMDIDKVSSDAVAETADELVKINNDQLLEGKNKYGKSVGKYRNKSYAIKKNQINPKPGLGNADLKLFGDYQKSRYAKVTGQNIQYGATDEKAEHLEKRFPDTYGLSDPFKEKYNEVLRPKFIDIIKKETGL